MGQSEGQDEMVQYEEALALLLAGFVALAAGAGNNKYRVRNPVVSSQAPVCGSHKPYYLHRLANVRSGLDFAKPTFLVAGRLIVCTLLFVHNS